LLGIFVANFSEPTPPFFLRWGRWGSIKTYGNLIGFSRGTMTLTRIESLPLILNTIYINGSFLMCLSPLLNLGFWGGVEYKGEGLITRHFLWIVQQSSLTLWKAQRN
jgi:hypothetical protein